MAVYIVALAVGLIYLMNVPVTAGVEARLGAGNRVRVGLGIFGHAWIFHKALPLDEAVLRRVFERAHKKKGGEKAKVSLAPVWDLWRRTRVLHLEAALNAGDACMTALGCGFLRALLALVGRRARATPDFSGDKAYLGAVCIVEACLGQIVLAGIKLTASMIRGKLRKWKSDRSKGSWPAPWNPFAIWWTSTR